TNRCGVHRRTTSMVPAFPGRTCQPLAKPFTSVDDPRSWPAAVASQPSLWLSPSTTQKGVPSVRIFRWYESGELSVTSTVAPEVRRRAPAAVTGVGSPAWSDDSTTRSRFHPVVRPSLVTSVLLPAGSASDGSHATTARP